MGTKVVGKLDDWGSADLGDGLFLKLEEGSNVLRLISAPYQTYSHWARDASGANRKVGCALKNCPLCEAGEKAQARWLVAAINRKTNSPVIVEIGTQIFKQVLGLSKKESWGDPRRYDIDVERKPKGSQPLYVVSPEPKAALTDEEKGIVKEFLANTDIDKLVAAPSPEEIREKMGMAAPETETGEGGGDSFGDFDDDFNFDD